MSIATGHRVTIVQLRMALACVVLAILAGVVGVLHYVPQLSPALHESGLGLTKLRPLHTTFASLWIFGAAIAVIYHFLATDGGGLQRGDLRRFWFHTVCWLGCGVGIAVTMAAGVFSGREYLGFHPAFSAVLLAGWVAFAYSFLRRALPGFWRAPVYIWFWTTGVLYFMYTFVEGHAYLLPWVEAHPVRDIGLHWKSCGTLVGSFNFLVYGSLIYVSEKLSGDRRYGQCTLAFLLFGVGCLNSFTNFAHHTYHLPQSHAVKWIAFVVSMMEVLILLRLLADIGRMLRQRARPDSYDATAGYLTSAKWWTAVMLTLSILISVPNLNSLIHGTHVVTGHAMGTELGIDSMILFGAVTFLLSDVYRRVPAARARLHAPRLRAQTIALNAAMALLVGWLTVSGTVHGIHRYHGEATPAWVLTGQEVVFPVTGAVLALALLHLVFSWAQLLTGVARRCGAAGADAPAGEPSAAS